jgi:hypothetical protein
MFFLWVAVEHFDRERRKISFATQSKSKIDKKQIEEIGGTYTVTEIDPKGRSLTYNLWDAPSALDVEEWCLKIPPSSVTTTPNGFPRLASNEIC